MGMLSDPLSNLRVLSVVRFYARLRAITGQFYCLWRFWDPAGLHPLAHLVSPWVVLRGAALLMIEGLFASN